MRRVLLAAACFGSIITCVSTPVSLDVDANEPLETTVKKPVRPVPGPGQILLDGRVVKVRWGDGDTFSLRSLTGKRKNARLAGFNALESYGPVHRWGDWTHAELYQLAKAAGQVAAASGWTCSTLPGGGGYGRLLVDCPDLERALLQQGLAHIFSIKGPGKPDLVAIQIDAQKRGAGFWAKGVPAGLVTSLHSADERSDRTQAYDRVVNAQTGEAPAVQHTKIYEVCQEVCHQGSCMIYVPFRMRYGAKRATCLR